MKILIFYILNQSLINLDKQLIILISEEKRMLPYRAPQIKLKKQQKSKPIPSLQLIHTLNTLCQNSQNTYDSKNHVLTLNDISTFQLSIQQKFARTFQSFQRQLKMLGFKCRKLDKQFVKVEEEENYNRNDHQVRVYRWRGKKELLIDQELNLIDKGLKQRRNQIEQTRDQIKLYQKSIDRQIESIIFSILVNSNSSTEKTKQIVNSLLQKTKFSVNDAELNIRKIINCISFTLGNELQLYKLLIYKQGITQKRLHEREDEVYGSGQADMEGQGEDYGEGYEGEGEGDGQNQHSYESQGDAIQEQSKGSMVSIQVEKDVKKEIKQEYNHE